MWQLRLIIILIGLVFIALMYLLSRQRKAKRLTPQRNEPSLDGVETVQIRSDTAAKRIESAHTGTGKGDEEVPVSRTHPAQDSRRLIVVLHVTGRDASEFEGDKVLAALQTNGLQYGRMHVFHREAEQGQGLSVFSVANMVEPGELKPEALGHQQIAGLTLFLVLPGPGDAVAACADMIATARALATQLQGEVQNENHTPFSVEDAQRIRQRVLEFQMSA